MKKTYPEKQIKNEQQVFKAYCSTRVCLVLVSHHPGRTQSKHKAHVLKILDLNEHLTIAKTRSIHIFTLPF